MSSDPYDRLPYTDHAYAESHPDRLAVVARLNRWEPPGVDRSRVLEVGCGRGGNLLPMAAGMADASLVGVDQSARQIAEARRIAEAARVSNVRFEQASFETVDLPQDSFDFVLCHGVCSWIPPAMRSVLLRRIARWLTPSGLAYVSLNALPGWYDKLAARDWLRCASRAWSDARSVDWLMRQVSPELGAYLDDLRRVSTRLHETDEAYLTHEYLADENHPQLVIEFLEEADREGLCYLGDAISASSAIELLPAEAAERARRCDVAQAQQLVDFVRNTSFRRAVLVRKDAAAEREWSWQPDLDVQAVDSMQVASRLRARPGQPGELEGPEGFVQLYDDAPRRALDELERVAPRAVAVADLARHVGVDSLALAPELFHLWLSTGGLDLHVFQPHFTTAPCAQPKACPVARWHAAEGGTVTNRWHQEVLLPDDAVRLVLARLDGTRSAAEIARELAAPGSDAGVLVSACIDLLARSALLIE